MDNNLYFFRARYQHRDGRKAYITYTTTRWDALRWAADYVRCCIQGYLLSIEQERSLNIQLKLT